MIFLPFFVDDPSDTIRNTYPHTLFALEHRERFRNVISRIDNDSSRLGMVSYAWPELRTTCQKVFAYKCAFCERALHQEEEQTLTYWRPSGYTANPSTGVVEGGQYPWLQNEARNVYYACAACIAAKGHYFPIWGTRQVPGSDWEKCRDEKPRLLAPYEENPNAHLIFESDGTVNSNTKKGVATITTFDLNRESLVIERQSAYQQVYNWLDTYTESSRDAEFQLRGLLDIMQPFAMCKRQALRQYTEERLKQDKLTPFHEQWRNTIIEQDEAILAATQKIYLSPIVPMSDSDVETKMLGDTTPILKKVVITNFRGIKSLTITMPDAKTPRSRTYRTELGRLSASYNESSPETCVPSMVLLGENGAGKTDVLQAIALALLSDQHRNQSLLHLPPYNELLHKGESKGKIEVDMSTGTFQFEFTASGGTQKYIPHRTGHPTPPVVVLGYGTFRDILLENRRAEGEPFPICNLFDNQDALLKVKWNPDEIEEVLKMAMRLVPNAVLRFTAAFGAEIQDIRVEHCDDGEIPPHHHSNGHRTVVFLVCDIIHKLLHFAKQSSALSLSKQIRFTKAVILIDELESHLHVSWKREIMPRLREEFPQVSFIVTTQDPFLTLSMNKDEVLRLYRQKNGEIGQEPINCEEIRTTTLEEIMDTDAFGTPEGWYDTLITD